MVGATDEPSPGPCDGAWLGFTIDDAYVGQGVRVRELAADGPARSAGLREGDVLSQVAGFAIADPAVLARWARQAQPGDQALVEVMRDGGITRVVMALWAVPLAVCEARIGTQQLAQQAAPRPPIEVGANPAVPQETRIAENAMRGRADGLKAMIAIGGFQIKAAQASAVIGDGLREMLISALHQSGYFIVVERDDLRGLMAEQDLSRSPLAAAGSALPATLDVADLMVFGAVTEFEPKAGGSSWASPMVGVPLVIGTKISWSKMALDVRVVDVRTARVLGAMRIPGMARSVQGTIGGVLPMGAIGVPAGLVAYRGTPMELAIRDCMHKSAYFVLNTVDEAYFSHR